MRKDTSYSSKENLPRRTLNSECLCCKWKGTHIHKRNSTDAQSTHCTSPNKSGRLQHPTLINGQILETETKQRHSETMRSYEINGFNRYRTFYPTKKDYTFFSVPHGTFSKIYYIIGHKTGLNRYKKIAIIPWILSDHHRLRLVFNSNKNNRKSTYTWKLNNALLNDNLVKEEIKNVRM